LTEDAAESMVFGVVTATTGWAPALKEECD